MLDGLRKPRFHSKSKMAVKLTKTRLEAINRKRNAVEKYLKKDIVDLLKNGLDYNAYGRVEGLLIEQNMSCCYRLIEQFCRSVSSNLSVMQKQTECPEDCREAVPSLMFAAARFADLPELRQLRSLFAEKYGTSLETFANEEFVRRLKAGPPCKDVKLQLMRDIALEHTVQWDSKALEQKLFTPPPATAEDQHPKYASPEETEDDSHGWSRRERRDFVPQRETEGVGSKLPREEPKRNESPSSLYRQKETNDIAVKLSSNGRRRDEEQEGKESNHSGRPSYRSIPPPYIKAKPEKEQSGAEENKVHGDKPAQEAKPKPRSVRQRRLKPPPGCEAEESSRATKTSDSNGKVDEEERVIDGLLIYYSKKKSTPYEPRNGLNDPPKPLPLPESNMSHDSSYSRRHRAGKSEFGSPPARAASLPAESTSPTEPDCTARGHNRAHSYQKEMSPGHVHPNLPDCDDLASRIAALRGR